MSRTTPNSWMLSGILSACLVACAPATTSGGEGLTQTAADIGDATEPLVMTFLDVGQGNCIHVACPAGGDLVIDCGSVEGAHHDDVVGRLRVLLDPEREVTLFVTHADEDHLNILAPTRRGEPALLNANVRGAWLGGIMEQYDQTEAGRSLIGWFEEAEIAASWLDPSAVSDEPAGFISCGEASVTVLAAGTPSQADSESMARNTPSLVLMLEHAGRRILLGGDATHETEAAILERFDDEFLDVDILGVAHHGSDHSTLPMENTRPWLDAVAPEYAVISAGHHNGYHHPRCDVVDAVLNRELAHVSNHGLECWADDWTTRETDEAIWTTHSNGEIRVRVGEDGRIAVLTAR